jgi:16S rRNA processing protein RimM
LTIKVAAGEAEAWRDLKRVWIGVVPAGALYEVEHGRGYRDRLVLKLRGIDDADSAAALRGATVRVPEDALPPLAEDEYYAARLLGATVVDVAGAVLGRVADVLPTGGTDLLVVDRAAGPESEGGGADELLIPLAREIVVGIDEDGGRITVRLPDGLLELNVLVPGKSS